MEHSKKVLKDLQQFDQPKLTAQRQSYLQIPNSNKGKK